MSLVAKLLAKLLTSKEGRRLLLGVLLGVVVLGLLVFAAVGAAVGWVFGLAGGGNGIPPSSRLGLWLPVVESEAGRAGIPPVLELGLISWESGGVWTATNVNSNGTTDAGLVQLNSVNWPRLGLTKDPYDPQRNVAAGVSMLAAAAARYPGDVAAALEAYNAGSAARGYIFAPEYASRVLQAVNGIEAGPTLGVWPLGGSEGTSGWQAPATPEPGQITFVVSAFAPLGPSQTFDGQQWPGLVPPSTLAATAPLSPCAGAPKALTDLLPPGASCWYATVPVLPGQTVSLSVTATWQRQATQSGATPGPAAGDARPSAAPPPVTASQSLSVQLEPSGGVAHA